MNIPPRTKKKNRKENPVEDDIAVINNSPKLDIESGTQTTNVNVDNQSDNGNDVGDEAEQVDENITIQIMGPTPVNSYGLSDSTDIDYLLTSNYTSTDNMSKEIRRATASTNTDTSDYLFNHTRVEIKQKLNATIVRDINDTIRWRFLFRKCGNYFEFLSLVTSLISTVFAFSAGSFDNPYLAFVAGCLGSISLAFMKATSYAMKESKERNEQLNIILDKAHIKYMPSLIQANS